MNGVCSLTACGKSGTTVGPFGAGGGSALTASERLKGFAGGNL